jgi:hypothetical protein
MRFCSTSGVIVIGFLGLRLSAVVALVLSNTLIGNSIAFAALPPMDAMTAKQAIATRGVGKRVKVTETDGTVVTGQIAAIEDEKFDVRAKDAAPAVPIPFSQVKDVHNAGLSKGAKIGIVLAVVGAAIAITAAVLIHDFNSGWPKTIPI